MKREALLAKISQHERAIRKTITGLGGVIERTHRNRHIRLYWKLGAEKFVETISCSSSDPYATNNAIRQIKRNVHARSARAV
jgi:hypothetical protein